MSTATFRQANHALTLINQQEPSEDDLQVMWPYFSDLVKATKQRTLPPRADFQRFVRIEPEVVVPQPVTPPPPCLQLVQTVQVSGATRFVAADFFKKGTGRKVKVWISYLGDNFKSVFVPKIEENVPDTDLRISRLTRSANNEAIRHELPKDHEAFLAHLAHLVSQQPHGESGVLLTNGYANIFYMFAANASLWEVYAFWNADMDDEGWKFSAYPVTYRVDWVDGHQVFSRDSGASAA